MLSNKVFNIWIFTIYSNVTINLKLLCKTIEKRLQLRDLQIFKMCKNSYLKTAQSIWVYQGTKLYNKHLTQTLRYGGYAS
jgi:hypothetical protein